MHFSWLVPSRSCGKAGVCSRFRVMFQHGPAGGHQPNRRLRERQSSATLRRDFTSNAMRIAMATVQLLTDDQLAPEALSVFADIRATYKTEYVNDFWRALANDPPTMRRTWVALKGSYGTGRTGA